MNFPDYFPIWDQLNQDQQDRLQNSAALRSAPRGTVSTAYSAATMPALHSILTVNFIFSYLGCF